MLSIFLLSLSFTNAQNLSPRDGFTLALDSATSFCLIIPFAFGDKNIAANDSTGVAACLGNPQGAKPTKPFPAGMITSAHYVKTNVYTQVTGTYSAAAYGLDPNDYGTQWDNSLRSQGGVMPFSGCAGFPQYLEFFGNQIFCVRCCNYAFSDYCNPSNDTQGCYGAIPGNFGPGFTNAQAPALPGRIVPIGLGCAPEIDRCSTGTVCCVANGDAATGNANKTSCQVSSGCVAGSFGRTFTVPPVLSSTITTLTYTAPPVSVSVTSSSARVTSTGSSTGSSGSSGSGGSGGNAGAGGDSGIPSANSAKSNSLALAFGIGILLFIIL